MDCETHASEPGTAARLDGFLAILTREGGLEASRAFPRIFGSTGAFVRARHDQRFFLGDSC
jgi:hypothetical protein